MQNEEGNNLYLFFLYLKWIPTLNEIDRILGCVFLLWFSGDDVDKNIENTPPMGRKRGAEVGEWYKMVSFQSVPDYVHVLRSKFVISSLTL